jgi:hypothetical protein
VAPGKERRPAAHRSGRAMVSSRSDNGRRYSTVASGLRWPETSSGRSYSTRPTRGEKKVHPMRGGMAHRDGQLAVASVGANKRQKGGLGGWCVRLAREEKGEEEGSGGDGRLTS